MTCDITRLNSDVSGAAGLYALMASVLAGFAFTAIAVLLPGTLPRRSQAQAEDTPASSSPPQVTRGADKHVLVALFGAFIALIAVTLEYAGLAGERGCSLVLGRAASEEMLGAVAFGFAVLMLLYALVLLIEHVRIGAAEHFRFLAAALVPPLGLFLIGKGTLAIAESPWHLPGAPGALYQPRLGPFTEQIDHLASWGPGLLGLVCLGLWLTGMQLARRRARQPERRAPAREQAAKLAILQFYPYAPLALSLTAVLRSYALSAINPAARLGHAEVWAWLVVCALFFILHSAVLSFVRASEGNGEE